MITANISKTKNELSRYLNAVRNGETVVILDRNRPIAQIQPLSPSVEGSSAHFEALAAQGLIAGPVAVNPNWSRQLQEPAEDPAGYVGSIEALLEEREFGR